MNHFKSKWSEQFIENENLAENERDLLKQNKLECFKSLHFFMHLFPTFSYK